MGIRYFLTKKTKYMKHFKLTANKKINTLGITLFQVELIIDCKFGKIGELGGWVEKEENLQGADAWLGINAEICLKGEIWGGEIRGGEIRGGEIRGGEIRGGVIRGGEIWGGEIRGGVIMGGVIWGGEIWGGVIRGGVIWGGEIRGGEIRGGVIMGGVIFKTPLQFCFSRHFGIVCKPGYIRIGCNEFSFEYWCENFQEIGKKENYTESEIETYGVFISLAVKIGNDCFSK